jgi:hypothetical protein
MGFGVVALCAVARPLSAQRVPARDLLEFPVGTIAEAPALATHSGDGIWNPATILLVGSARTRVMAAALDAGSDRGLKSQLLAVAVAIPAQTTVAISILHASVSELVRTDGDPQSIGEIPYGTMLVSASAARRTSRYLVGGIALRYRSGVADVMRGGELGIDGGVLADDLPFRHARLAASTFLWRPATGRDERTRFNVAGDVRIAGSDSLHEARMGYAFALTEPKEREHYLVVEGRLRILEARVGLLREDVYGAAHWRDRIGLGVHYGRYAIGIAREDSGSGLRPIYQFLLSSIFP